MAHLQFIKFFVLYPKEHSVGRKVVYINPNPKKVYSKPKYRDTNILLGDAKNENKTRLIQAPANAVATRTGMPSNQVPISVKCKCGWCGTDDDLLCLDTCDILWCPICRKSQWDFA